VPEVAFVMSADQQRPMRELAETLKYELELQGVPGELHVGVFPDVVPQRVYVVLDPLGYWSVERRPLPDPAILGRTIFVYPEAPSSADDEHLRLLAQAGAVFALDQRSQIAIERLGLRARLLRPGYSKSLDRFDPDAARPIDAISVGPRSPRQNKYVEHAAQVMSRHGLRLDVGGDGVTPIREEALPAEDRLPLLTQAKLFINIHADEDARFEWTRALDAIHAGAVVVTEHSSGLAPLVPGEHLITAGPCSLPYVAEAVLRDERRLAELRARAYERLSTWLPFALPVSVLRAAVVEVVGQPLPSRASVSRSD
jgi:hypothetical protein